MTLQESYDRICELNDPWKMYIRYKERVYSVSTVNREVDNFGHHWFTLFCSAFNSNTDFRFILDSTEDIALAEFLMLP